MVGGSIESGVEGQCLGKWQTFIFVYNLNKFNAGIHLSFFPDLSKCVFVYQQVYQYVCASVCPKIQGLHVNC